MKIRIGFVSNSSSSNFIIIGKEIQFDRLTEKDIKEGKIYCKGGDLYEGSDFFEIDKDMYKIIKIEKPTEDMSFYHVILYAEESYRLDEELVIPPKYSIMSECVDMYTTADCDSLMATYYKKGPKYEGEN